MLTDRLPKAIVKVIPPDSPEWAWDESKTWLPVLSGDHHQEKILNHYPLARPLYHRDGRRWYAGEMVVGEIRGRNRGRNWEGWLLEESDAQKRYR